MSVSESIDKARIVILNKNKTGGSIGVRTRDDTAVKEEDYIAIDKVVTFSVGEPS